MQQLQLRTYKPEEVAEIYQVSKNTIYKMIKNGELLAKRINDRQYRIPARELLWVTKGVDADILKMEQRDLDVLDEDARQTLKEARRGRQ